MNWRIWGLILIIVLKANAQNKKMLIGFTDSLGQKSFYTANRLKISDTTNIKIVEPKAKNEEGEVLVDIGGRFIYAYNNNIIGNTFANNALGIGANLGYAVFKKPSVPITFILGLNFDYLWFGGKSTQSGIYRINVNSNAYGWSPYLKLQVGNSFFKPFFYATSGLRFFNGKYKLSWDVDDGQGVTTRKNDGHNFTNDFSSFSGIGGGFSYGVLEVRANFNKGRTASIVNPSSIILDADGNLESYSKKTSETNLWLISIGLTFN